MKAVFALCFVIVGLLIACEGIRLLVSQAHGVGITELAQLEESIRLKVGDVPEIKKAASVLKTRLASASYQGIEGSMVLCAAGTLQIIAGVSFALVAVASRVRKNGNRD
jgi:hypothetical protein